MKRISNKIFLLFTCSLIVSFSSNAQPIQKTKVLVLGTLHLEQTKNVQEKYINRVLDSLMTYHFDAIAIEQMPPELLLDINSRPEFYWKDLISNFEYTLNTGTQYQKLYGINYDSAKTIIANLLNKVKLTEADRINVIKASLCAYDPWTASLQFQFINDKNSLDSSTNALLKNYNNSLNEINLIGVKLAKKLNINTLYPIDNLQDETILLHDFPEFLIDYKASRDKISLLLKNPFYERLDSIETNNIKKGDLYETYKFLNSDEYMSEDKKGQWDIWFKTNFKSKTDRSRYSLWEMRNLQIAANIMRLVASNPEKKILVIIGSAHKSFLENNLKQMSDVELLKF